MDVVVRSRNAVVGQRFKSSAQDKLDRLARLDGKADRVDVEVSEERNPRQSASRVHVELTCHTRGAAVRAAGAATDAFAALDVAIGKLVQQLRRAADRRRVHHGSRAPQSIASAMESVADEPIDPEL
ncbi:MAG TPA: ribosome-associated translation inhibitor RaiA [Mycobacteriales bacterium]|jgi:ribosomal subunit interface protein|nr:ribosome-associated translation inhibitor RaiA [Mycobacteriales bacterium]